MARKRLFRQLYVHPGFQGRMIGFNLLIVLSVLLAVFVQNTLDQEKLYLLGKIAELPPDHPFFVLQDAHQRKWLTLFLCFAAILCSLSVGVSLWLSHKVLGPLHRIKLFLNQCLSDPKKVRPLKFRNGDYLHEIADLLNRVLFK